MSKTKTANTYAERLAAGLVQIGFHEVPGKSKKYREFRQDKFRNYYVGKAGALRAGDSASGSWSMGDPSHQSSTYKHVLREGDRLLEKSGALSPETKIKLASSGITMCDVATLGTLAESDPLLARALGNL